MYIVFLIIVVAVCFYFSRQTATSTEVTNTEYQKMLESGSVDTAVIH